MEIGSTVEEPVTNTLPPSVFDDEPVVSGVEALSLPPQAARGSAIAQVATRAQFLNFI